MPVIPDWKRAQAYLAQARIFLEKFVQTQVKEGGRLPVDDLTICFFSVCFPETTSIGQSIENGCAIGKGVTFRRT